MKAVAFEHDRLVVRPSEAEPSPGPDEVLIRVSACAVSRIDASVLKVHHDLQESVGVGFEVSGVIRELGSNVTEFALGDEVISSPTSWAPSTLSATPNALELPGDAGHGPVAARYEDCWLRRMLLCLQRLVRP